MEGKKMYAKRRLNLLSSKIIFLFIIISIFILYINQSMSFRSLRNVIINIYMKSSKSISVNMIAGLGNRIMSFAGIIILSIYFESKPLSIFVYIFDSRKLE